MATIVSTLLTTQPASDGNWDELIALLVVAYIKCLSACPLNWGDKPNTERKVIAAAVNSCYFPLYEVEQGITTLSFDPEQKGKKIPVDEWLAMMGRTKHLCGDRYSSVRESIQKEVDRRWKRLKLLSEHLEL